MRRGSIRVDASRAAEKIREHLLAEPEAWLAEVVRAAKLSGATRVDLAWDADDLYVAIDGAPWPRRVVEQLETCVVADAATPRAARLLAVGVFAALGHEAQRIDVAARTDDEGVASRRYRRRDIGDETGGAGARTVERTEAAPATLSRLGADHALVLHVRRGPSFAVLGRFFTGSAPPEVALLAERLREGAVPVYVDGEPIDRPVRPRALVGVEADHGGMVVALELVDATTEPLAIECVELGIVVAVEPWTPSFLTVPRDGVHAPLRATLSGELLPTNVSRSKLREDALGECVRVASGALRALIARAREVIRADAGDEGRATEDALGGLAWVHAEARGDGSTTSDPTADVALDPILEVGLLASGTGAPRTIQQLLAPGRDVVVHVGEEPLAARFAPVDADVFWRRPGRLVDRLVVGRPFDAATKTFERGAERAARLAATPPPPFGPTSQADTLLAHSFTDPIGTFRAAFALRESGPTTVRCWVHGRPFCTLDGAKGLLPGDVDVAWEGVIDADGSYERVSCESAVLERVERAVLDLQLSAIAARRDELLRDHPRVLRAWSAVNPAAWCNHRVAEIPIWPTVRGGARSTHDMAKGIRTDGGYRWVSRHDQHGPHAPVAPVYVLEEQRTLRAHVPHTAIGVEYGRWLHVPARNPAAVRARLEKAAPGAPIIERTESLAMHCALAGRGFILHMHRGELVTDEPFGGVVGYAVEWDGILPVSGKTRNINDVQRGAAELALVDAFLAEPDRDLRADDALTDALLQLAPKHLELRKSGEALRRLPLFRLVDAGLVVRASADEIGARLATNPIPYADAPMPHVDVHAVLTELSAGLLARLLGRPVTPIPSESASDVAQRTAILDALERLEATPTKQAPAWAPPPPPRAPAPVERSTRLEARPPPASEPVRRRVVAEVARELFSGESAFGDPRALTALAVFAEARLDLVTARIDPRPTAARDAPFVRQEADPQVTIRSAHPVIAALVARGDAANLVAAIREATASSDHARFAGILLEVLQVESGALPL